MAELALPQDGRISAAFLGAAVLELTGRTGESPWFDFLNQLRREAPVVQKQSYLTPQGQALPLQEAEASLTGQIDKWRKWSYYKLRYKVIP